MARTEATTDTWRDKDMGEGDSAMLIVRLLQRVRELEADVLTLSTKVAALEELISPL